MICVCGVPLPWGQLRRWDEAFASISAHGVGAFFPMSQYVEIPTPLADPWGNDFGPPYTGPAFDAMRAHGVKLVAVGEQLYPRGLSLPSLANDPLQALINAVGLPNVHSILTIDEPILQGASEAECSARYQRIKMVAPSLPVLMVQAPMLAEHPLFDTTTERSSYLAKCVRYAAYADIVGFDVYPITPGYAKVLTPYTGSQWTTSHIKAVADYCRWLKEKLPTKRHLMVLQGMAHRDQYSVEVQAQYSEAELATVRAPTQQELRDMALACAGVEMRIWYGPSFIKTEPSQLWADVLTVSAEL